MCNRTKCIYLGQHYAGVCDYLSKTGKSRIAQIAKEMQLPTTHEDVISLADGKVCPFYRQRGEDEKPLQAVLAEMRFRAAAKKQKKNKKFAPKVTDEEAKRIRKWYNKGLSDKHIAEKENVPEYKVRAWREKNKLESNFLKKRALDEKKAMKLYRMGMTDVEIAKELGRSAPSIYSWRCREGLSANLKTTRLQKEKQELRTRLYREGATDEQIAEQTGTAKSTVRAWRQYHKLPANDARKRYIFDRALMREYYLRGMNDREVSEKLGCYNSTVAAWRKENGLPPNRNRRKG